jgi:hypothetical protein
MSIRTEMQEFSDALVKAGVRFVDEVPNKTEWPSIAADVFGVLMEGKDFASIPRQDRLLAIAHALAKASGSVMDKVVKYSDEETAPPAPAGGSVGPMDDQ